ncbi:MULTISPECIES: hypothetical protein [unclassified Streptomyces]|uniref:hypothetical protein n=1 Tax=unclassified Streptomyces TaxID=2593676 RepID=UPI00227034BC|nr:MULTISPECIES: hypothetical protein [unclassified Streptomyces]MCY0919134.1 hypothetical protein [Streptomyces sp. H27-G5]MCY0957780.1 hypothetical protein [Streptomyces sp. H27-H5]
MTAFLLAVHVVAAILAVGPVTVAASMFPAAARRVRSGESCEPPAGSGASDASDVGAVRLLHRVCRVYAVVGVAVPVFGLATASSLGVLTDAWLITSMVLTAAAAAILALRILPGQEAVLVGLDEGAAPVERAATARLAMFTGVFNLLWVTVTVLMIIRPGSTTGA